MHGPRNKTKKSYVCLQCVRIRMSVHVVLLKYLDLFKNREFSNRSIQLLTIVLIRTSNITLNSKCDRLR
jgi:hypothetical protein